MKLFGLTGGIGMGKTTAARLLAAQGVAWVDTDQIARDLVEPGQPALGEIAAAFGASVLAADGQLRRDELARVVFADAAARRKLEAILHPRIRAVWLQLAEQWRAAGLPVGVVVIPLLFETDAAGEFHKTICLACSAADQRVRLRARGWTDEQIGQRLAAQLPIAEKMERADHVIWTEGTLAATGEQLRRVIG